MIRMSFSVPVLHLWVLGPAKAQSSSTLPPLLHLLYDRTRLSGHNTLLHNPKRLSVLLLCLLDQTVGHVQDPETFNSQKTHS